MNTIQKKLRSTGGFTLTELLVAVVILGLVTLAVSVGISSGIQVYQQSVTLSNSQTLVSTLTQAISDELHYAQNIQVSGGNVTFTSKDYGSKVTIDTDADGLVTVGGYALVGSGAYAGMKSALGVSYDTTKQCFEVSLTITQGSTTVQTANFTVRPLNT